VIARIAPLLCCSIGCGSPATPEPPPAPAPVIRPAPTAGGYHLSALVTYRGICDASAAAGLPDGRIAVGDDEDNQLRIFDAARGGDPIEVIDTRAHLAEADGTHPEMDIEGAATVGTRVYWIASHARKKSGKAAPGRLKLFASDIAGGRLALVGKPYLHLLEDMTRAPALARYRLADAGERPPDTPGGLNIEGLTETPEGHLLIGFRSPVPGGRALLVRVENPAQMIERGTRAALGDPIELELEGRGVRTLSTWAGAYWIVGGAPAEPTSPSRVYRWEGGADRPVHVASVEVGDLNPEALAEVETGGTTKLLLISDDGSRDVGGAECKRLKDPSRKAFRAAWLDKDR
jgi:hypothetical protein